MTSEGTRPLREAPEIALDNPRPQCNRIHVEADPEGNGLCTRQDRD